MESSILARMLAQHDLSQGYLIVGLPRIIMLELARFGNQVGDAI